MPKLSQHFVCKMVTKTTRVGGNLWKTKLNCMNEYAWSLILRTKPFLARVRDDHRRVGCQKCAESPGPSSQDLSDSLVLPVVPLLTCSTGDKISQVEKTPHPKPKKSVSTQTAPKHTNPKQTGPQHPATPKHCFCLFFPASAALKEQILLRFVVYP